MAGRRKAENAIDWEAIERQYRLGSKSNKQLAEEFSVSASSIGRRAAKRGWVVDKSEEVAATTNSLLIQNASGNANPNATPTDKEIKVAAQTNADVVLGHRKGLKRLSLLRDNLLDELEIVTNNRALFDQLGELLDESGPDQNGRGKNDRVNEIYRKIISLSGRVDDMKKLAEIDEKIRKGEREAFGIDKSDGEASPIDELLKKIHAERMAA